MRREGWGGLEAALVAALALAGCQTAPEREPIIRTIQVPIPVAVRCAPDVGPRPDYPDTSAAILSAPNVKERARLYGAGRPLREQRERELEAALAECAAPPPIEVGSIVGAPAPQ